MRVQIILLLFLLPIVPALQITEVESNPLGTDGGNEWMELYSEEEINLENYIFTNNDGNELSFNFSFQGYFVHTFQTQWLDNSDEKISIHHQGNLIDETPLFEDLFNNENTFSFCKEWIFQEGTKGKENCEEKKVEEPKENITKTSKLPERNISFPNKTKNNNPPDPINLNPKTIKTQDSTSRLQETGIMKYSLGIFCILLGLLYTIKPKKRKNEWRNKSNGNDGH